MPKREPKRILADGELYGLRECYEAMLTANSGSKEEECAFDNWVSALIENDFDALLARLEAAERLLGAFVASDNAGLQPCSCRRCVKARAHFAACAKDSTA